jgi:methionyl-tRNA formyltransferase
MLRLAFAGTPEFAVPTLRAIADSPHQLVGVLTQPDRPAGRGRELRASAVKRLALELGLPIAQPASLSSAEGRAALEGWAADALVVVAYGLILPAAVLSLPRLGCLNVHASLLPRWRGAAPIQRAILAGDASTGVTIMQMDAGLDTGPILAQQDTPIGAEATAAQLQSRLGELGARLLLDTLAALAAGNLQPTAQPQQGVTYAGKISKAEARIDWQRPAAQLARQVRAFNPWPVAHTLWREQPLRIWEAQAIEPPASGALAPGEVLGMSQQALLVGCGQGVLAIRSLQPAGRRVMLAADFAAGQDTRGSHLG